MKISFWLLTAITLSILPGCVKRVYTIPPRHRPCITNYDCPRGEFCGFVDVDTVVTCRQ